MFIIALFFAALCLAVGLINWRKNDLNKALAILGGIGIVLACLIFAAALTVG